MGGALASCGDEDYVYLWDAANGTMLAKLQGHRGMCQEYRLESGWEASGQLRGCRGWRAIGLGRT